MQPPLLTQHTSPMCLYSASLSSPFSLIACSKSLFPSPLRPHMLQNSEHIHPELLRQQRIRFVQHQHFATVSLQSPRPADVRYPPRGPNHNGWLVELEGLLLPLRIRSPNQLLNGSLHMTATPICVAMSDDCPPRLYKNSVVGEPRKPVRMCGRKQTWHVFD